MPGVDKRPQFEKSLFGLALALALGVIHFLFVPINWLTFVGISQLLYVLPLIAVCRRVRRNEMVEGLIVGASFILLLNIYYVAT